MMLEIWRPSRSLPKAVSVPRCVDLDPVVQFMLETILERQVPWSSFDPGVRQWIYKPPVGDGPRIGFVRRNLQVALGLDLVIAPYVDRMADD